MDEIDRIIEDCRAEGFNVAYDEEQQALQIQPEGKTPLGDLSGATFEQWLNEDIWERAERELQRMERSVL